MFAGGPKNYSYATELAYFIILFYYPIYAFLSIFLNEENPNYGLCKPTDHLSGGARVLPPGANVCVAAPANQIGNWYYYGTYNDGIGVDCHEQYTKLGGVIT